MFITCSSTNGLHLSTEVFLCTGTSNVARDISSDSSVCNSVCSFLVNAQSLQRFEGISSYFGILANFNFSSTNQICGSQGSRSLWQEKKHVFNREATIQMLIMTILYITVK